MSENGLPSLLERHWAEGALAIGAVVIPTVWPDSGPDQ